MSIFLCRSGPPQRPDRHPNARREANYRQPVTENSDEDIEGDDSHEASHEFREDAL
jgi:hypothetical protein